MTTHETGWSSEEQLLFHCIRQVLVRPDDAAHGHETPDAMTYTGTLDRDLLIERAIEGGVAPLAYLCLKDEAYRMPAPVIERLREAYFYTAAENVRYLEYARRLFGACVDTGIEVIALRGIAFAESLYPDIALRPISDIDLLIHPEDRARLDILLEELGYWRIDEHPHQWTNASIVIDVHVDLVGADRIAARGRAAHIDMDAVWEASMPVIIAGIQTRMLSWVDTLLTCSLHVIKHSCDRMMWFADLAALLERRGVTSWEMVTARARRFHLSKPVYYALSYAMRTLGVAIPEEVMEALRPLHVGWVEHRCMARVLRGEPAGRFGEVFTLFMMDHGIDRLTFILETCFPGREVLGQAYGAAAVKLPSRSKRLWHVADMAFGVIKHGIHGSKL